MNRRPTRDKDPADQPPKTGKISDVFGILKREGQPTLTIEQIKEASGPDWPDFDLDEEG